MNRILLKTNRSSLRLPEVQVLMCFCGDFLAFSQSLLKSCAISSEDFAAILRRAHSFINAAALVIIENAAQLTSNRWFNGPGRGKPSGCGNYRRVEPTPNSPFSAPGPPKVQYWRGD